jgi:hypothetical protein
MMSMPERQVASAGLQPSRAVALAKRAPSMWSLRPRAFATSATPRIRQRVDRTRSVIRRVRRPLQAGRDGAVRRDRQSPARCIGADLAVTAGHCDDLRPPPKTRWLGLRGVDVCDLAAINIAPGRAERGQSQSVGRRPGGDRKHPHGGLEQLGKALLQCGRVIVCAIPESSAMVGADQRLEDLGCGPACCHCGNQSSLPYRDHHHIRSRI